MNVQEITKDVVRHLAINEVSGLNPGEILTVIIAAKDCGHINEPSNTQLKIGAKSCPLYTDYKKSCEALKEHDRQLGRTT